jgi:hypothetical protein
LAKSLYADYRMVSGDLQYEFQDGEKLKEEAFYLAKCLGVCYYKIQDI